MPAQAEEAISPAWCSVLGVNADASRAEIERAFRSKAQSAHPDHGGSTDGMRRLLEARMAAVADRRD